MSSTNEPMTQGVSAQEVPALQEPERSVSDAVTTDSGTGTGTGTAPDAAHGAALSSPPEASTRAEEAAVFERWSKTQIRFVQDPRAAVAEAEALIDEIVEARRKAFDAHRASITDRWRGADADTEELRLILQDYRKVLGDLFPREA